MTAVDEKRKVRRFDFREAIEYQVIEGSQDIERTTPSERKFINLRRGCLGFDLSEEGLRLYTDDFIPLHKEMLVNFQLRNQEMIELAGRVVWIQKVPHGEYYHIGLKFSDSASHIHSKGELQRLLQFRPVK